MAASNDIELKIQALVDGLENVASLTGELKELEQQGKTPVEDNTKDLRAGADDTATSLEGVRANIGKVAAAAGGLAAIGAFLKASVRDSTDADTRMRVLEATIRATGGAAGLTAEEVSNMARDMARATLGSVEGFEKAATQLLTFKSVGKDAFGQVLESAQDLAQAGFGNLENNARTLGRALEEPARASEILRRVQIDLSEQQKQTIEDLIAVGDTAGAQAAILEAVSDRVGGIGRAAAEGLAGSFDSLAQAFLEAREASGKAIEPALIKLVDELVKAIEWLTNNMDEALRVATALGATLLAMSARNVIAGLGSLATQVAVMATNLNAATVAARALAIAQRAIPMVALATAAGGLTYYLLRLSAAKKEARIASHELARQEGELILYLEDVAHSTGLAITNQEEFAAAIANGSIVVDQATGKWIAAAEAARRLAVEEAKAASEARNFADESTAAGAAAAELQRQFETEQEAARAMADQILAIGEASANVADDVGRLVAGLDLANSQTLGDLLQAMMLLDDESAEIAATLREKVLASLKDLNEPGLLEFGRALAQNLETGRVSAEDFARINNGLLTESLRRLGLTVDEAFGRFPEHAHTAVQSVEAVDQALRNSGATAEEYGKAMSAALAAAIPKAGTLEELGRLRNMVSDLAADGKISADQLRNFNLALDENEKKLRAAADGAEALTYQFRDLQAGAADAKKGLQDVGNELDQVGDKTETNADRARQAMGDWFASVVNEGMETTRRWSEATEQLYHQLRGATDAAQGMADSQQLASGDAAALRDRLEELGHALRDVRQIQQTLSQGSLTRWAAAQSEAAYRAERSYLQQRLAMEALIERTEHGVMSIRELADATAAAETQFHLLDQSDLSRLHTAIDSARARMEALRDSTENTLATLQDELLRLQGNEDELARRRLARREAELQAQLAEARAIGADESVRALQGSLGVLQKIGAEEDRQRQQRQQEQASRDTGRDLPAAPTRTAQTQSTQTVRHEIRVGGQTVAIDTAPGQDRAIEQLLRAIELDLGRSQ